MTANIHPTSGYAYGFVASTDLDDEVVLCLLYGQGVKDFVNHTYNEAQRLAINEQRAEWENRCEMELLQHDLTVAYPTLPDFAFVGVKYRSSWLGGACCFFILESPHITTTAHRASPCVPNAGILKHPIERCGDVLGYDTPPTWWATGLGMGIKDWCLGEEF